MGCGKVVRMSEGSLNYSSSKGVNLFWSRHVLKIPGNISHDKKNTRSIKSKRQNGHLPKYEQIGLKLLVCKSTSLNRQLL